MDLLREFKFFRRSISRRLLVDADRHYKATSFHRRHGIKMTDYGKFRVWEVVHVPYLADDL